LLIHSAFDSLFVHLKHTSPRVIRYFLLHFFLFFVIFGYTQNTTKDCSTRINNREQKIFKRLPTIKDTSISGISKIKGVSIQYLGAGGILISKGETVIAFDPFFSNNAIKYRQWFRPWKKSLILQPDIEELKEVGAIKNLQNVTALFVTHAHYDHLFDVPYLYEKTMLKHPKIYGNTSVKTLLKNLVPDSDVINIQDSAAQFSKQEMHWINIEKNFRVSPIFADHAPHYEFVKFFDGEATASPTKEEYYKGTSPALWNEGRTLTYIVEIIENTDTLRMHIQTAACSPPEGLPPVSYMNQIKNIDISILCMASFNYVSNYPDSLINYLKPKQIVIVHWENFFKKYSLNRKHYKIVPFTNAMCFIDRMEQLLYPATVKSKCLLPVPNSFIRLE
jgi:hypothetical protein